MFSAALTAALLVAALDAGTATPSGSAAGARTRLDGAAAARADAGSTARDSTGSTTRTADAGQPGAASARRPSSPLGQARDAGASADRKTPAGSRTLRVLVRLFSEQYLPPQANPEHHELGLLAAVAARHGMTLETVAVERFDELIPALLAGRGDVVAAGLTITKERQALVAFTRPIEVVDEVLVGAPHGELIQRVEQLAGKRVHVAAGTAFVETLQALKAKVPTLELVEETGARPPDQLAWEVSRDLKPFTVVDSRRLPAIQQYNPDVVPMVRLAKDRPIAFALRKDDGVLRAWLDSYLMENAFLGDADDAVSQGDLGAIKKRGALRVITRNNAVSFYLYRGERLGFDYELALMLAKRLGVRLDVVLAPSYDQMIPMLLEGKGDLIAASFTKTPAREAQVAFSRPYLFVKEVLVERRQGADGGVRPAASLQALKGRRITVRPSSSYAQTLAPLAAQHGFTVVAADESAEVEELIADVGTGAADLTVADSHFLAAELLWRRDVAAGLALTLDQPIAFAVRKDNPELLAAVDGFVKATWQGLEYNLLKRRCFENRALATRARVEDSAKTGRLSPWDGIVRRWSQQYGFDWRLMSAQAWRESRFDPQAKSWVGALGLFQVMPDTGKEMGFTRLTDPDVGTQAGIKYMSTLVRRLEPSLPLTERVRFSLAAYNAGFGRVEDARRLAVELKLDPDVWSGNVEKAMALLARPRYSKRSRSGYCRCQEPVDYVNDIDEKYAAFVQLVPEVPAGK